jgi:hypothetical protein
MVPIGAAGVPPAALPNAVLVYMMKANCSPVVLFSITQALAELFLLEALDTLYLSLSSHFAVL